MLLNALPEFYDREMLKLADEISAYPDEAGVWEVRGQVSNSAGNLCLHQVGNLNHFIGATLGQTGYVRERDKEFSDKHVPRAELLSAIERTRAVVRDTLTRLDPSVLDKEFPLDKHGQTISTEYMLLHLFSHLNYHLGQINYHRRMGA